MSKWGLIDNTLEGRQSVYFPHFTRNQVPIDPGANRAWRHKMFNLTSPRDRKAIRKACKEDFLFYCAGFLYIYDAGDESGKPGPVPFIPHEFQIECITVMYACLHDLRQPLRGKKPRRIGFTWMGVALFEHAWHNLNDCHLLVGSHREEEVEGTLAMSKGGKYVGEWSKLMPKFDFLHIHQPQWLLPDGYKPRVEPYRTRMKLMNPANGSIVWGTSASAAAGHGERGYAVLWDEASRTDNLYDIIGGLQAFAKCKFWISTIGNLDHPFSTILKEAPGVVQLNPEWWMNPEYTKDLTIDPETGKRSSPWLIQKLSEINNDPIKANELYYADETVQVGGYYAPSTFRAMTGGDDPTVMPPIHVGELDIIEKKEGRRVVRFCEQANGRWSLWMHLDREGNPPRNTRYIMGADTAAGTRLSGGRGPSNSVVAVADWMTGEIVCEFITDGLQPLELAWIVEAMGHWFEGDDGQPALVIPESNGPGGQLVDALVRKVWYPNVWVSDADKMEYGWFKDGRGDDARLAFGLHQEMICDGRLKERSARCVREMRHYQHNPNGKGAPVHSAALLADDPSEKQQNHGDTVIARVCICQALQKPYSSLPLRGEAPYGSYRWATEQERKHELEAALIGTPEFLR